jgi:hypothetical protein
MGDGCRARTGTGAAGSHRPPSVRGEPITRGLRLALCAPPRAISAADHVAAGRRRPSEAVGTRVSLLPRLEWRSHRMRRSEGDASQSHEQCGQLPPGERAPGLYRPSRQFPDCGCCGRRGGSAARRTSPHGMMEAARMDSLVRSGADQPKIGTTVDLLAYTPCKAEPQAEGETSAGFMIRTRLTAWHEVLFGRQCRFDRHEPRYLVWTEKMKRGFDRGAGVFGRRGRGKHETGPARSPKCSVRLG